MKIKMIIIIMIRVVIITIMIMMIKIILLIAVIIMIVIIITMIIIIMIIIIIILLIIIIINNPFQPGDFSTGSTTENARERLLLLKKIMYFKSRLSNAHQGTDCNDLRFQRQSTLQKNRGNTKNFSFQFHYSKFSQKSILHALITLGV